MSDPASSLEETVRDLTCARGPVKVLYLAADASAAEAMANAFHRDHPDSELIAVSTGIEFSDALSQPIALDAILADHRPPAPLRSAVPGRLPRCCVAWQ